MYRHVYILHAEGEKPQTNAVPLAQMLDTQHLGVEFITPILPYGDPPVIFSVWSDLLNRKELIQPNSLLIGLGWSGLLAAKLQETHPKVDVIALNSPTELHSIRLQRVRAGKLVALYSSRFPHLSQLKHDWDTYTREAHDLLWLRSGITSMRYSTVRLLDQVIKGGELYALPFIPRRPDDYPVIR